MRLVFAVINGLIGGAMGWASVQSFSKGETVTGVLALGCNFSGEEVNATAVGG